MGIDWLALDSYWATCTFHEPVAWEQGRRAWRSFLARLERRWPALLGALWRLDLQQRGAPHFHLLIGFPVGEGPEPVPFSNWCRRTWAEITGAVVGGAIVDAAAWAHAVRVQPVELHGGRAGVAKLTHYLVKAMGEVTGPAVDPETGEVLACGRVWAVRGHLPTLPPQVLELDQKAYGRFLERVNREGERVGSWYLASVNERWRGFSLVGDGSELAALYGLVAEADPTETERAGPEGERVDR